LICIRTSESRIAAINLYQFFRLIFEGQIPLKLVQPSLTNFFLFLRNYKPCTTFPFSLKLTCHF
uniref:Ovule protein n=1 Tax=Brugia timori TaxID=42155 RepID=A0A0R3QFE5_9BILA